MYPVRWENLRHLIYSRLQETIPMAIDFLNSRLICYTNMVWLDPDKLPILLVGFIYAKISLPLSSLEHQP